MTFDILTTKAWVIFLFFLFIVGPTVILMDYIGIVFDYEPVAILGQIVLLSIYFLYPMLVGFRLRAILSSQPLYTKRKNTSLAIDCCIIAIAYVTTELFQVHGKAPNIFLAIVGIAGLVSFIRLGSFPAHEIKSIELKRNAGIWEYVSETFQMIYWPLGVLWMQPRINRIASKRTITISG
jgi:hypothetical protein